MSYRSLSLVALVGCNQLYGLESTQLPSGDSARTDCPDIGTAPRYSPAIRQAVQQPCSDYHFNASGTLAAAICSDSSIYGQIYLGKRDDALVAQTVFAPSADLTTFYFSPRPAPGEARLYAIRRTTAPAIAYALLRYEQTSPGAWTNTGNVPITITALHKISSVFRGASGDRLFLIHASLTQMVEYEDGGGTWVERGVHPKPAMFTGYTSFTVSPDGLRAVYRSDDGKHMLYVDRPDLGSSFGAPQPIEGAPVVNTAQLTGDCTRLYYDGLDSIFYSTQE